MEWSTMAIGYACVTIGVPNTRLSRCILKNAEEDNLRKLIDHNLSALEAMIDYNRSHHISLFRISSDLIPFASHPANSIVWWEEYKEVIKKIGTKKIKKAGIRVSMHPGQYTILNALDSKIVQNALKDLIYHDRLLTTLGMDQTSKLVLHIGGVYGDKSNAMKTFIKNYNKLPSSVKNRIVIENDDRNYTIEEVLSVSNEVGTPVVFDHLHHNVNPSETMMPEQEWIKKCEETWKPSDGKQKIHYSQQKNGAAPGTHSDTIFYEHFLSFYRSLPNQTIDIMLEVKDKNISAIKCNHIISHAPSSRLEEEWEKYRYYILSQSVESYHKIEEILKTKKDGLANAFYHEIEVASALKENVEAQINAAQQIWEHINNYTTTVEKNRYERLLQAYREGQGTIKPVKNHLYKCAFRSGHKEITNALYFYL